MKYFRWKDKNTSVSPDFTLSQKLVHLTIFTLKSQNFFIDFLNFNKEVYFGEAKSYNYKKKY